MINYTSNNVKRGYYSTSGPRVEYATKRQMSSGAGCLVGLAAMIMIALAVILLLGGFTLFEDGSWMLGTFSGCLPGALCSL